MGGVLGCLDSDDDGYSDTTDTFPVDGTQWSDVDEDGYINDCVQVSRSIGDYEAKFVEGEDDDGEDEDGTSTDLSATTEMLAEAAPAAKEQTPRVKRY